MSAFRYIIALSALAFPIGRFITQAAGPAAIDFNQAPVIRVPDSSLFSATGDFNEDGKPDLALSTGYTINSGSIMVLLNAGDQSFAPPISVYVGGTVPLVATTDLDRDGHLDLAAANGTNIAVFLGDGVGGFTRSDEYLCDSAPIVLAIEDMNRDGAPDLLVASRLPEVLVLINDGAGHLNSRHSIPLSAVVTALTTADLNSDGDPDLAVVHHGSDTLDIVIGNGDGTFQAAISLQAGPEFSCVAAGDFNEDGRPDLVAFGGDEMAVYFGTEGGGFGLRNVITIPFSLFHYKAETGDYNGDGHRDVVWASGDSTINLGLGDGRGDFQTSYYGAGKTVQTFAVGDFDGDLKPDIAVPGAIGSTLTLLHNKGNGTFAGPVAYGYGVLVDLDHDGRLDLIGGNDQNDRLYARLGNGDGTFGEIRSSALADEGYSGALGDLDNDGYPDFVSLLYSNGVATNRVGVLLGNGDGTFASGPTHLLIGRALGLVLGDFDNDGRLDVAAEGIGTNAGVCLGNGDGTFASELEIPESANRGPMAVGDLNNDGNLDLVLRMDVFLGHGDGTLSFLKTTTTGIQNLPYLGDLNGDGNLDLIGVSIRGGSTIFLGDGRGDFIEFSHLTAGIGGAAIADFNRDGRPDVVFSNSHDVAVLLGNGDGTFINGGYFFSAGSPVVGDVNGDGQIDIVGGGLVLLNQTFTKLSVTRPATETVVTWPSYTAGLMLESTESLAAPDWRRVPAPVSVVDDRYVGTNATTRPTQFFRLRRQ